MDLVDSETEISKEVSNAITAPTNEK